jgi:hypothetical protein
MLQYQKTNPKFKNLIVQVTQKTQETIDILPLFTPIML